MIRYLVPVCVADIGDPDATLSGSRNINVVDTFAEVNHATAPGPGVEYARADWYMLIDYHVGITRDSHAVRFGTACALDQVKPSVNQHPCRVADVGVVMVGDYNFQGASIQRHSTAG